MTDADSFCAGCGAPAVSRAATDDTVAAPTLPPPPALPGGAPDATRPRRARRHDVPPPPPPGAPVATVEPRERLPSPRELRRAEGEVRRAARAQGRRRKRIGRRWRVTGLILLALGVASLGGWGGWVLRDRNQATVAPATVNVSVSRPVIALDTPARLATTMPNIVGLSVEQARQVLADAGVDPVGVSESALPQGGPAGLVVTQDPSAGAPLAQAVHLEVSAATTVPDLVGATVDAARQQLGGLGVRVEVSTQYAAGSPVGTVLSMSPAVNEPLGTSVTVTVAEAGSSVFLSNLRAVDSSCYADSVTVNAQQFANSVVCQVDYDRISTAEYLLNRRVDTFEVTIGLDDRSTTGVSVRLRVFVDGARVYDQGVGYGQSVDVSVPVTNALRIRLEVARVTRTDQCCDVDAVWGQARLVGGQSAVDALIAESNS